ncbi:putative dsRNA-binding protein [Rhodococcus ruber]
MPMDRWDALALRAALANRSLWCGHLLGGCGRQLTTKIGRQRVPHFAHFPDPEGLPAPCRRTNTDASSADHLFIHAGIKDLLHRDGRRSARVRFDGEFGTGGTCHWITIDLPEEQGVIVVALRGADLSDWQEREERLRSSAPWVSWLFGPGLRAPQRLLHRDGFAMHLLFDNHRPGRPLQLGTQLPDTPTEWIDLSEARFGDNGLTTPASARAHCAHREQPAAPAPAPVPVPPPAEVSAEPAAPAPVPPPEVSAEPAASPRTVPRMMTLDNGMELPVPELRVLLGRIAQKYGFAEDPAKVRLITEHARALRPDVGRRVEFPSWLQRDIDAALGVQSKHADEDARPLDPGPTVDQLPLPEAVVTLVRELGWDPAADPLRTRWLKLACAHSSYLYEHREIGVEPNVLDMLQELGKRWLTLAVLDSFALEYRAKSAGEQSQVLARLRHTLFDLLASAPDFTNHLLLGRGEALMMQNSEYQAKTRVQIDGVLQICGTLALLGGIDSLYDLVRRWYPQVKDTIRSGDGATDAVDWKTALNQLEAAIVFDTTPSGPDHDRQFTATVSNGRGRTGRGTGRSKKAAERAAAEDFVRTHAPAQATRLIASVRTSFRCQVQVRPRVLPREHHPAQWYAIDAARKLFDLPSDADPYLTQALIHSSWAYENQRAADQAKQRDNTVLAHHGSAVVDALTAQRRAEHILASTLTPNADDARITTPEERIWREAFAASPMAHGLFLGKGEQKDPSRAFANAMQAVLAVAWRFRGQDLLRTLPRELTLHADRAADGSVDHYTRLMESCRPFGLELEETYRVSGPDHLRSFECTIQISSLSARISEVGAAVSPAMSMGPS